jgi:hypothetical protein
MEIFVVSVLALVAGLAVYQIAMRASQPQPRRNLPGARFVRDAMSGIDRLRKREATSSVSAGPPPAPALATGGAVGGSAPGSPVRTSAVVTEERTAPIDFDPEQALAPIEPLSLEDAAVPADAKQQDGLFGGTLPPVVARPDDAWDAPGDDRYVPLASGYRSFQTRVIGFVGLTILIALLAVAITFSIYVASSTVVRKVSNYANSPAPNVPTKIVKAPGSPGSHHASPGSAAG